MKHIFTFYTQPFIDLRKRKITLKRKYFYFSWNLSEKVFLIFDAIEIKIQNFYFRVVDNAIESNYNENV